LPRHVRPNLLILITGASGFSGQNLFTYLGNTNPSLSALYNSNKPKVIDGSVVWQHCDLLDVFAVEEAMKGVEQVYHCAAQVGFEPGQRDQLIRNNVQATANVVNAALEAGVKKMIHVSSVAALGRALVTDQPGTQLINEETHWEDHPHNSAYAESKYHSEMEVWRGMAEGLNAAIVNPPVMLGAGDFTKGSAQLMQVVDSEFPWYTRGVNAWVDVRDVVYAMKLLMDSDIHHQRFIISAGNHSYHKVFSLMAEALGKKAPHRLASPFMTELVWRWAALKQGLTGKKSTVTRETARVAQLDCRYDNAKFLTAFPKFDYRSLEETIQDMAHAYKAEHPTP